MSVIDRSRGLHIPLPTPYQIKQLIQYFEINKTQHHRRIKAVAVSIFLLHVLNKNSYEHTVVIIMSEELMKRVLRRWGEMRVSQEEGRQSQEF